MIFPALLRRALAFAAVLLLAAFGLVLVHTLMGGTLPSPVTGIGAAAAVAVLAICAATIVKTDDYLTPRHTRFFFIATTAIAFLLAGGTIAFILTSENLPGSFSQSFGLGSLAAATAYACVAWMRIREADLLPAQYRPEKNPVKNTVIPLLVSVPALAVASGALFWSVQTLNTEPTPPPVFAETPSAASAEPANVLNERAQEVFEFAMSAKEEGRYRTAHDSFHRAADLRHPEADYQLALLYAGDGYLQDFESAREHLEQAIALDHLDATFLLGKAYRHGELDLERDPAEARRLLQIAAEKDHIGAQSQLAHMHNNGEGGPVDYEAAFRWFLRAAEQGDAVAQNDVGIFYLQGKAVETDVEKGIEWLMRAAEQGVAVAEYNLGRAFHSGEIVEQDYGRARVYFQRLAEKEIPYGFQMVGLQYLHGYGSQKNEQAAFEAFREGAARGDTVSQYYLGYCFLKGLGTEKDSAAAIDLLSAAAAKNHPEAQLLLGNIYRDGHVLLADEIEAAKWYRISAENGSEEAASEFENLTAEFSSAQIRQLEEQLELFTRETGQ